ncbi:hypothetical protein [Herbaspirillum sp.]|uniref:hypothetical protein n=1 Tax=Herbaspirillum sp. TaxID=1890675 RepID=UPI000C0A8FBC|nr:hypothetical protein [Herbaspirillum sp.]MAF04373.1 hypothetical protein [Herbaspirillum sp.]|tara:strand:+ start:3440 stop:3886 length:447 start_codon:yes stop_codon:yes gene_type:complete
MTTTPIAWPEAQRICDIPEVREALDKFAADAHEENMLAMVSAIMGHASAQGRAAGLEEAAKFFDVNDTSLFWGSQAAGNIRALSPTSSDAGKDDVRDAARYRWLRECGAEFNKLEILDICGYIDAEALDEAIDAAMSSLEVIGKGEKK